MIGPPGMRRCLRGDKRQNEASRPGDETAWGDRFFRFINKTRKKHLCSEGRPRNAETEGRWDGEEGGEEEWVSRFNS